MHPRLSAVLIVALLTGAAAPVPDAPDPGRTVTYCNILFSETGAQRNAQADLLAQRAAQLDMANQDLANAQAEIAALQAEVDKLKKPPHK